MKLPVATLTFVLFFQTACSLNLKTFDAKSTGDDTLISVKGNFPLGEPLFTGFEKYSMSITGSNKVVFKDNFGEIHVVSSAGIQTHRFTPTGIAQVLDIATDTAGNIYVSAFETTNGDSLILKYAIDGTNRQEIVRMPAYDTGGGVFASVQLYDLKVGPDGSVFVHTLEGNTTKIEQFSSSGTPLNEITVPDGTGLGQAHLLQQYVPNADGSVYIVDLDTDRIQKLNANGTPAGAAINWTRSYASSNIDAFIRNADGSFLIAETGTTSTLHKIDSTGTTLWTKTGAESGTVYTAFNTMSLLKVGSNYYLAVADLLYVYSESGALVDFYQKTMTGPSAVVRASDGSFFVGITTGIMKYSQTGQQQNTFGSALAFRALAVSPKDVLYSINLLAGGTIEKYDLDGTSLGSFASTATTGSGMCVDKDDNVYVSDAAAIIKIAADETTITTFKTGMYTSLHCNSDGTLFALYFTGATTEAQKLDASGNVLFSFDQSGGGAFLLSYGMSVSPSGNVVITDFTGNRIHVFNAANGDYIRSFGNAGIQALSSPMGIFIDKFNEIFVADKDNNFVKKFSLTGTLMTE